MESAGRKSIAALIAAGISAGGLYFVSSMEGRVHEAYPDPGVGWNLPTICDGHTRGVKRGDKATDAQCDAWLNEDMRKAGEPLAACVKKTLSRGEYEPLASFNYNTGGACRSAPVAAINAGKSCDEIADLFYWTAPIQYVCSRRDTITGECQKREPNIYLGSVPILDFSGRVLLSPGEPIRQYTTGGMKPLRGLMRRRIEEGERFRAACKAADAEEGKRA